MKRLKRSECAVLHLGLKHYWYRMIESGVKQVEFREASPYWNVRIDNWSKRMQGKTPVLEFQNGYGRFSPRMWFAAWPNNKARRARNGMGRMEGECERNNLIQWPRAQYWDKPWNPAVAGGDAAGMGNGGEAGEP